MHIMHFLYNDCILQNARRGQGAQIGLLQTQNQSPPPQ